MSARALALDLLEAVLRRGRPLDEVIEAHPGFPRLAPRDRAFARLLAATVLRRLGQIDALIDGCLERPLKGKAAPARDLLRLGLAQLLFLDTPAHAAVHDTVGLAAARRVPGQRGLINAVLRRLADAGPALLAAQDAARLNTPGWLWRSWTAAYGEATARAIAAAHLSEPPLDITVKDDPQRWAARLSARLLPTGTLRRPAGGAVTELPGFAEGDWWVQDAAAALPVRLMGDVSGKTVIDLCAAPGGKTAQLAALGASVIAVDRSRRRLRRLVRNLDRLRLGVATVEADATRWTPPAPADAVLVDAPCSTTGAIRRHPDVAWIKTPADVARMAALQGRLLAAAANLIRPGGTLVFCTCSLEPEEGPERVAELLAAGVPLARRPVRAAEIGGLKDCLTADGDLRTLPCHLGAEGGLDGFYAARLERTV
ncbi:MAG: RsmB/NOP family class I SAM-dependent RNA methyltransferase [Kiloniellales bacterium]